MWDEKSVYSKIETSYAFISDTNDEIVEKFNTQTFTQGCASLKGLYCNPPDLLIQNLPIKEKVK